MTFFQSAVLSTVFLFAIINRVVGFLTQLFSPQWFFPFSLFILILIKREGRRLGAISSNTRIPGCHLGNKHTWFNTDYKGESDGKEELWLFLESGFHKVPKSPLMNAIICNTNWVSFICFHLTHSFIFFFIVSLSEVCACFFPIGHLKSVSSLSIELHKYSSPHCRDLWLSH